MDTTTKLASASIRSLFYDIGYWFRNELPFILVFLASIALFILLFNLNFPRFNDPLVIISVVIYLFALWGIYLVAHSLIKISIEKAIADRVSLNLQKDLRKIRGKEKDRIDLEQVPSLLPSVNEDKFKSAMMRLILHIIDDAQDRKFESSDVVMRPDK